MGRHSTATSTARAFHANAAPRKPQTSQMETRDLIPKLHESICSKFAFATRRSLRTAPPQSNAQCDLLSRTHLRCPFLGIVCDAFTNQQGICPAHALQRTTQAQRVHLNDRPQGIQGHGYWFAASLHQASGSRATLTVVKLQSPSAQDAQAKRLQRSPHVRVSDPHGLHGLHQAPATLTATPR